MGTFSCLLLLGILSEPETLDPQALNPKLLNSLNPKPYTLPYALRPYARRA